MIFCTVGTTDFDPLVQALDALAPTLAEPVLFQIGQGAYLPQHGEWFRFQPSLDAHFQQASLVVAHGGFGTTIEVLRWHKPLISVLNPDRYDGHQEEILRRFAADGHLIPCFDLADLPAALARARDAHFIPYQPPQTTLPQEIRGFLDQIARRRA
ncbi:MAG: hypothetical protein HUU23_08075 [Caldilineales bacterium]|nr:hypothetical protein [Caldilineales bacterium]